MLRAVAAQKPRNRLFGALLLGLRRLEALRRAPAMDPAVVEETLGYYEERAWMELESRAQDVEIIDKTCARFKSIPFKWCSKPQRAVGTQPSLRFLLRVCSSRRDICVWVGVEAHLSGEYDLFTAY